METLLTGIGVGLAVAAPVGPIGILCIRRSLTEGRATGLATGLGAASADAVYGMIAATGLAVSGVLISHADLLRVGGGTLIALLGILSLRAFFLNRTTSEFVSTSRGLLAAFLTTFALTLGNPMTILAFVGLIAGLGAAIDNTLAPYLLVVGVFIGSAVWWLFLVHVALAVKTRLTPAVTRWLDLISGSVLLTWGLWIVFA
ncbi:MAG: LysE family transporter [Rhodobacteraceae bacterium]|nr:LysE family transporter [Paracoccaceae bacterium]